MTKEQLMDAHFELFEKGAELWASYNAGEYIGIENEYEALSNEILTEMQSLRESIDTFDEPLTHE